MPVSGPSCWTICRSRTYTCKLNTARSCFNLICSSHVISENSIFLSVKFLSCFKKKLCLIVSSLLDSLANDKIFGYWRSLFGGEGWILAKFSFCMFIDHNMQERTRTACSHLVRTSLINKVFVLWALMNLPRLREQLSGGTKRVTRSGQETAIFPGRVGSHSAALYILTLLFAIYVVQCHRQET